MWLRNIDPKLGVELPEKNYAANCTFYDDGHQDPFHGIKVHFNDTGCRVTGEYEFRLSYKCSGAGLAID